MQASVQYQSQVGQASQHSQVAGQQISDRNGNQIAGRPNTSSILYTLVTADATKPQGGHFIPPNGAYWSGHRPAARAHQQTVSSLQVPTGGKTYHQGAYTQDSAAMQASCVDVQSGNHPLAEGVNEIPQQAFHQISSQNRQNQNPPNGMVGRTDLYVLQGYVSNWNQVPIQDKQPAVTQDVSSNLVPLTGLQNGNVSYCVPLTGLQYGNVENASYQNVNRVPVQHNPPLSAASTSVQHHGTSMSTTTYNQKMTHNLNHSSGHRVPPHTAALSQISPSQSLGSISHVTSDSLSGHPLMQSTSQLSQQNTGMANSSSPSATHPSGSQWTVDGLNFVKMNRLHTSIGASTVHYVPNSQMIPGNANNVNLHQTAGSEHRFLMVNNNAGHPGNRLVFTTRDGMAQAGQTVQPEVSSSLEHCNSNTPHALKLQSGQTLPNPTCGLQSSNRQRSEAPPPYCQLSNRHRSEVPPPPYCPVQKGFYVTVTEDKSGKGFKVDNIIFLGHNADKNGIVQGGLQRCSPNNALQKEQFHQSAGKTSLQRNGQHSLENRHQLPQTPGSSSKRNDSSNHISPGHAGQKAVAVVLPLSQASYKGVCIDQCKTTTTDKSGSTHEDTSIVRPFADDIAKSTSFTHRQKSVDENVCPEMSTEEGADATSNRPTRPPGTPPNNLLAEVVESRPSDRMQCQATPTFQQSVTAEAPSSQSEEPGETRRQDNPVADEFELTSVPVIPWTYNKLTKLTEKADNTICLHLSQSGFTVPDVSKTILSMFWEGSCENVLMKMDSYTNIINEVEEFCSKHVASDSVIVSMVSHTCWRKLEKNCYALRHATDHPTNTYKSSWLNTNEQLDDIDKEFGFPWSLKYGLKILERDEQPTPIETENGVPECTASEMQNEAPSDDDYVEKQASSARDGLNQTPVPLENATADSVDSNYSFKIHVLPPEEARLIFEKLKTEQVKTEKTEDHSENIINISVEDDLPEIVNVTFGEVKLENKVQAPTLEFCCTARWMEVMGGSNTHSPCGCQRRREQSADGVTAKSFEEEKAVQTENLHVIETVKLDPTIECKIKEDIGNAVGNQTVTPTRTELCEMLIDLTEEDEMPLSHTNMEPKHILQSSTPSVDHSGYSNIIVREIDDFFSCNESELSILISGFEVDCGQSEQKRPGPAQTGLNTERQNQTHISLNDESLDPRLTATEKTDQVQTHISLKDESLDPRLTATEKTDQVQTQISLKDESLDPRLTATEKTDQVSFLSSLSLARRNPCIPRPKNNLSLKARRRRKRRAEAPDSILPFLKKIKVALDPNSQPASEDNLKPVNESFNGNGNTDDLEPSRRNVITVKLALFGSSPQKKHGTVTNGQGSLRSRLMSSRKNFFSDSAPVPPTTITVTFNSRQARPTEFTPVVGSLVMKSSDKPGISEEPSAAGPELDRPVEQPVLEEPSAAGPELDRPVEQPVLEEPSAAGPELDRPVEQPVSEEPSVSGPLLRSTVRQRVHEEWKNRFVPTKRKSRGRAMKKRLFVSLYDVRPKKTEAGPSAVTEELPVSPPGTDKTKRPLNRQSREALLNRLRMRVAKSKRRVVMPQKPANTERSKYELGNTVLMPLQENNVLRFSVLPQTFNFNHGPVDTEESADPQLDMPDPDKTKSKDKRPKGPWAPSPDKNAPLPSVDSQVLKTTATFQEYQKKYKEKRRSSK